MRICDDLGLHLNYIISNDNLDFKYGILVKLWSCDVLQCVIKRWKSWLWKLWNELEILPQRANFGIDGKLCNIICLQNNLKWHDLGSVVI